MLRDTLPDSGKPSPVAMGDLVGLVPNQSCKTPQIET